MRRALAGAALMVGLGLALPASAHWNHRGAGGRAPAAYRAPHAWAAPRAANWAHGQAQVEHHGEAYHRAPAGWHFEPHRGASAGQRQASEAVRYHPAPGQAGMHWRPAQAPATGPANLPNPSTLTTDALHQESVALGVGAQAQGSIAVGQARLSAAALPNQ